MIKVLIDADMFVFRACSSCERIVDWGNNIFTLHVDLGEAQAHFIATLNTAIERGLQGMKAEGDFEVVFCFSDIDNNFRKKVLPTYKANRSGKRRPVAFADLRQWVIDNYTTCFKDSLEADDCIGILATRKANKGKALIISGDKDLKCIPAYHYDFIHDESFLIDDKQAYYNFLLQTLTGDVTDGYGGCPKVGKVTAERMLNKKCAWDTVVKAYKNQGLTEDDALVQARVARILQASDYDFKKKEVKLWSPPYKNH